MSAIAARDDQTALDTGVRDLALATGAVMLALLPSTIWAEAIDERTLNGVRLWLKPMHFQLALTLHFWTLAFLTRLLSEPWLRSRWVKGTMMAASLSTLAETAWLMIQAARGTASHFNKNSPLEQGIYIAMGLAAVGIVSGAITMGYAIARSGDGKTVSQLRRGAALGLMLGGAATVIVAGVMSSGTSHLVGGPQTDAFGLPFLGWATRGGDLRVAHFFATHAMQALPLAGFFADRTPLARTTWLMPAIATIYFAIVAAVFVEALMSLPLLSL